MHHTNNSVDEQIQFTVTDGAPVSTLCNMRVSVWNHTTITPSRQEKAMHSSLALWRKLQQFNIDVNLRGFFSNVILNFKLRIPSHFGYRNST